MRGVLPAPDPLDPAQWGPGGDVDASPTQPDGRAVGAGPIHLVIFGEPASKANQRQIVTIGNRPAVIKSKKARNYERDALRQIPPSARRRIEGPVRVTLHLYYATERPDLDESVVLDVLQDRWSKRQTNGERILVQAGIYRNDRQVREKHVHHRIDRANPRAEITIEAMQAQQGDLL
jgi:Holliday junction resolvase RusA-like endonuclease